MKVIYFLFLSFIFFSTNVIAQKVTYTYVFRIKEVTSYAVAKPYFDLIRNQFNTPGLFANLLMFDNKEFFFKISSQISVSETYFRDLLFEKSLSLRDFEFTEIKK